MNNRSLATVSSPFMDFAKKFFNDDFGYFPTFERKNSGLSNVSETETEYLVELSAPGLKKEDIKIELENDVLKTSSDNQDKREEEKDGYYRKEFYRSSFERSFSLPKNANRDEISATMVDGILNVSIPKVKEEKKKDTIQISIK